MRPEVEALESRRLFSVTIDEFPIPTASSGPIEITPGPDGNLWFAEPNANKVGQINPTTHAIAEFPVPSSNSQPSRLAVGPDGNLWFAENNQVGQINPTTHAIAVFPVPSANGALGGITAGPDGNLWFTEFTAGQIGFINPTTHAIAEFPIPSTIQSLPSGITTGPDGNLWFAEFGTDQIGEINPTTHAIAQLPVPSANGGPIAITVGPDGNLWFAETSGKIGQINPTTHAIAEFPIPTANGDPTAITVGPDGSLWFTEAQRDQIGVINPTTHAIAEFPVPSATSRPVAIASGPDGNLWFTEEIGNRIGRVVLTAPPTAPDLSLSGDAPSSVTLGDNVTYTLTVANDGTSGATGVALTDTLPSGVRFVSATGGVAPVNGVLTFHIGDLAAGASVHFTIVVTPTAAAALRNQAGVGGDEADPTPADNSVTQLTTVTQAASVDGPIVTSVERFGSPRQPAGLVLTFNESLDPTRAQDPANYVLFALGRRRRFLRRNRHPITIRSAAYDAGGARVTLSFAGRRLARHGVYELVVKGAAPGGLIGLDGRYLDGREDGQPGTDYVTVLDGGL